MCAAFMFCTVLTCSQGFGSNYFTQASNAGAEGVPPPGGDFFGDAPSSQSYGHHLPTDLMMSQVSSECDTVDVLLSRPHERLRWHAASATQGLCVLFEWRGTDGL